jgi:hypothetical protein
MATSIPPAAILGPLGNFSSDILHEFAFGADFDFGQEFSLKEMALIGLLATSIMTVSLSSIPKMGAIAVVTNAIAVAGQICHSACTVSRA